MSMTRLKVFALVERDAYFSVVFFADNPLTDPLWPNRQVLHFRCDFSPCMPTAQLCANP